MSAWVIFAAGFVFGVAAQIALMRWMRGYLDQYGMFDDDSGKDD